MYGCDPDAMNFLMDFARTVSSNGGKFSYSFDESMRLNEILLQTRTMANYARKFNDFTVVDATFSVSAYDLILIVMTNVDSFGKSTMTGFAFAESETSAVTVRALELFGLKRKEATLMSDGASAYALASQVCEMQHVLCVQHYRTGILAARAGMPVDLADSFMRECNDLIFRCYPNVEVFDSTLEELHIKYASYRNAVKFLDKIQSDSDRVCATKTSQLFSAGHVSSQRAESNNARIKKDDLRKLNLLELVKHLISLCERQDVNTLELLIKRVEANKYWSVYVEKILENRRKASYKFDEMEQSEDGRWLVSSHRQYSSVHHVTTHTEGDLENFTSCTCGDFLSSLLPCSAVCYAYNKLDKEILQLKTLHPRWRLDGHPLIDKALEALSLLKIPECPPELEYPSEADGIETRSELDLYQQIICPTKQATRFQKIDEVCKQISAIGSNKSDHVYRLTMLKCNQLLSEIRNAFDKGIASNTVSSIQPPKRKKRGPGRIPSQPENQSRLFHLAKNKPNRGQGSGRIEPSPEQKKATSENVQNEDENESESERICEQINTVMHGMLGFGDDFKSETHPDFAGGSADPNFKISHFFSSIHSSDLVHENRYE